MPTPSPLLYRKTVRDAVLAFLAAGFNARINAFASIYGIAPFTLDFTTASVNFAVASIDPANIENCQIDWSGDVNVGGCLYTGDLVNDGGPKEWNVASKLFVHLDLYVRQRTGIEGFNTEDEFDCIEDAAVSTIQNLDNRWPGGVIYSRDFAGTRERSIPLGDGFAARIPLKFLFEVFVQ
jgi:hypothetical protein